jgi:hypothetical protein
MDEFVVFELNTYGEVADETEAHAKKHNLPFTRSGVHVGMLVAKPPRYLPHIIQGTIPVAMGSLARCTVFRGRYFSKSQIIDFVQTVRRRK